MSSSKERPDQVIVVAGIETKLLTVSVIPLRFTVITNAVQRGKGRSQIGTEARIRATRCRSPMITRFRSEGFDPAACKGLAMTTIGED